MQMRDESYKFRSSVLSTASLASPLPQHRHLMVSFSARTTIVFDSGSSLFSHLLFSHLSAMNNVCLLEHKNTTGTNFNRRDRKAM